MQDRGVSQTCRLERVAGCGIIGAQALARAEGHYARWGYWSLLLSFAPVIGDPLTVIAGVLREPFWRFVVLVSISKIGRYLALAWLTLRWTA